MGELTLPEYSTRGFAGDRRVFGPRASSIEKLSSELPPCVKSGNARPIADVLIRVSGRFGDQRSVKALYFFAVSRSSGSF